MKKNILIIESSITSSRLNVLDSALEMEVNPIFLCRNLNKYETYNIDEYVKNGLDCLEVGQASTSEVISLLDSRDVHFDGVVCITDSSIEMAAEVAQHFGLPFISVEAAKLCRNKENLSQLCVDINVLHPKFEKISPSSDCKSVIEKVGLPCVIKPSLGTGSVAVEFCDNKSDIVAISQLVKQNCLDKTAEVLVHEYIPGPIVSAECIVSNSDLHFLGITNRIMGELPNFVEVGTTFPSRIGMEGEIKNICSKIVRYLKIETAVLHVEFILSDKGPVLLEINPRLGGMLIGETISYAHQKDIYAQIIKLSLGIPVDFSVRPSRAMTTYLLYPQKSGTIKKIKGLDLVESFSVVKEVIQHLHEGDQVQYPPKDFRGDKIATIIVVGDNDSCASMNCFAALSMINVDVG